MKDSRSNAIAFLRRLQTALDLQAAAIEIDRQRQRRATEVRNRRVYKSFCRQILNADAIDI